MENKLRATTVQVCGHCGREFHAQRSDAKTCSNACRQQAYLTRSAPRTVQKLIGWIENDIRDLETRRGYLNKQNLDYVFLKIKELANSWYYDRLPYGHQLRNYVERTLVMKLDGLRNSLLTNP